MATTPSLQEVVEGKEWNWAQQEEKILALWDELDAFKEQLRRTEGKPEFVFFDGPPFATGLPHYGHILAGTLKVRYVKECMECACMANGGGKQADPRRAPPAKKRAAVDAVFDAPRCMRCCAAKKTAGTRAPRHAVKTPPNPPPSNQRQTKKQDIVTRYASCTGRHVIRRFGWDCHGLPVEHEIDKKLGAGCGDHAAWGHDGAFTWVDADRVCGAAGPPPPLDQLQLQL